jgi:nicotinamide mononucleotide adenylyltransferase
MTKTIGITFGRWNPPHKGHLALWEMMKENERFYIGTNEDTHDIDNPLPFNLKRDIIISMMPEIQDYFFEESTWLTLAERIYKDHGKVNLVCYTDEDWVLPLVKEYNGDGYHFKKISVKKTPRLSSGTDLRKAVSDGDRDSFVEAAGFSEVTIDDKVLDYFDLVKKNMNTHIKEDIPNKYRAGLSDTTAEKRKKFWVKLGKYPFTKSEYEKAEKVPGDSKETRSSKYNKRYKEMYESMWVEAKDMFPQEPTGNKIQGPLKITYKTPREGMYTAHHKGKRIAAAVTWNDLKHGKFSIYKSETHPDYRRMGVMRGLYDYIEKTTGKELHPSSTLSNDGYEFWAKYRPEAVKDDLRRYKDKLIGKEVTHPTYGKGIISKVGSGITIAKKENGNTFPVTVDYLKKLNLIEEIDALRDKSEKSGVPYSILKKIYDRGMAAWVTGHRPGATQHAWAFARVNSFLTKGKTWKTADADLAKEARKYMKENTEYEKYEDNEIEMATSQLKKIADLAQDAMNYIQNQNELDAWMQDKISVSVHNMEAIYDYFHYSEDYISEDKFAYTRSGFIDPNGNVINGNHEYIAKNNGFKNRKEPVTKNWIRFYITVAGEAAYQYKDLRKAHPFIKKHIEDNLHLIDKIWLDGKNSSSFSENRLIKWFEYKKRKSQQYEEVQLTEKHFYDYPYYGWITPSGKIIMDSYKTTERKFHKSLFAHGYETGLITDEEINSVLERLEGMRGKGSKISQMTKEEKVETFNSKADASVTTAERDGFVRFLVDFIFETEKYTTYFGSPIAKKPTPKIMKAIGEVMYKIVTDKKIGINSKFSITWSGGESGEMKYSEFYVDSDFSALKLKKLPLSETVVKKNNKYWLYSKSGEKLLGGPYKSKKEVLNRERQVQYFKHKKG